MTFKIKLVEMLAFFEKIEAGGVNKFYIRCATHALGEQLSFFYDGTLTGRSCKKIRIYKNTTPNPPYYLAKDDGLDLVIFERVVK